MAFFIAHLALGLVKSGNSQSSWPPGGNTQIYQGPDDQSVSTYADWHISTCNTMSHHMERDSELRFLVRFGRFRLCVVPESPSSGRLQAARAAERLEAARRDRLREYGDRA